MNESDVKEFIAHYGTKGMKWGVRKPRRVSSDYKQTSNLRGRNPSELTNKQLKSVNERVQLEVNYRRLHPHTINRGNVKAKEILAVLGTAAAFYTMSQSPAGKALAASGKNFAQKLAVEQLPKVARRVIRPTIG